MSLYELSPGFSRFKNQRWRLHAGRTECLLSPLPPPPPQNYGYLFNWIFHFLINAWYSTDLEKWELFRVENNSPTECLLSVSSKGRKDLPWNCITSTFKTVKTIFSSESTRSSKFCAPLAVHAYYLKTKTLKYLRVPYTLHTRHRCLLRQENKSWKLWAWVSER